MRMISTLYTELKESEAANDKETKIGLQVHELEIVQSLKISEQKNH